MNIKDAISRYWIQIDKATDALNELEIASEEMLSIADDAEVEDDDQLGMEAKDEMGQMAEDFVRGMGDVNRAFIQNSTRSMEEYGR